MAKGKIRRARLRACFTVASGEPKEGPCDQYVPDRSGDCRGTFDSRSGNRDAQNDGENEEMRVSMPKVTK